MILKHYLLAAALLLCGLSSTHAINRAELIKYAQTLKGKKGAELKAVVHPLLSPKKVLEYGSGTENTWWGFWYTDRDPEDQRMLQPLQFQQISATTSKVSESMSTTKALSSSTVKR